VDNLGYLIAAYVIIWLGLFAYLFWMSGMLKTLGAEVEELRLRLRARSDQSEAGAQPPAPVEAAGR